MARAADGRAATTRLVPALLVAILTVGAIAALLVTRELRRGEDVVSPVRLTHRISAGGSDAARIRFRLAEGDELAGVEVIDSEDELIAPLVSRPLEPGRHVFEWNGRTAAGSPAPPGVYRVRIVLGEQDREIVPAGLIRVETPGAP